MLGAFVPSAHVRTLAVVALLLLIPLGGVPLLAEQATGEPAGSGGYFVPVTPFRLVDTTTGTGGSSTPIGPTATRTYQVLGQGDIAASDVSAVVVDVAALSLTSGSSSAFRLWAGGEPMVDPTVLRFDSAHLPVSNTAIVPVGAAGAISIYNSQGSANFNLDVQGYFTTASGSATGGAFVPIEPTRVVDTVGGIGLPAAELAAGTDYDVSILGSGVPATATGVFANIKVQGAEVDGGLRVGPGDLDTSSSPASLNYQAGVYSDSGITIDLSDDGRIRLRNLGTAGTSVHVRVDVQGYFTGELSNGGAYTPIAATRFYDSRESTNIPAGATRVVPAAGLAGLPPAGQVGAITTTVLAMNWTTSGSIVVFNPDEGVPGTSNVSFNTATSPSTGVTSTSIVAPSAVGGELAIKNTSSGPVDVLLTAQGWFGAPNVFHELAPAVVYDTQTDVAMEPGEDRGIQVTGYAGVPASAANGQVLLRLTASQWSGDGSLIVYRGDVDRPETPTLTYSGTYTSPMSTTVLVGLSYEGLILLTNTGDHPVHVKLEALGWYAGPYEPMDDQDTTDPSEPSTPIRTTSNGSCDLPDGDLTPADLPAGSSVTECDAVGRLVVLDEIGLQVPPPGEGVGGDALAVDGTVADFELEVSDTGVISYPVDPAPSEPDPPGAPSAASPAECDDSAYTLIDSKEYGTYNWWIGDGGMPGALSRTQARSAFADAINNITDQSTHCHVSADRVGARSDYQGRTSYEADIAVRDGRTVCTARDGKSTWDAGRLASPKIAYTCWWTWPNPGVANDLREADVRFNTHDYNFTDSPHVSCSNKYDVRSLGTHEAGHVYGLGHVGSGHANLTMHNSFSPCDTRARSLGLGDVKALWERYWD